MPVTIKGTNYFRTAEVCRMVGISRNTLYRWCEEAELPGDMHRDFRGWRLFTEEQLDSLLTKTGSVITVSKQASR
ncbi:DNA binding domain-containing protein, excisionase family [Dehalogenimonas formicexedens]|uniref:DNA binding domain-containing protein, excisionase family n=1 Tax=Dehalogenimonas formicexedens TaxID=1839801 RepID=A0A1P8F7P2_9CHLR|nr:helix-turn-helix domain-containing protein [Dehalogenimonas formicexedens]APV44491.1 DNA binding domain-containing protein, excisionase family [Dehalogenimonas formicexedens]